MTDFMNAKMSEWGKSKEIMQDKLHKCLKYKFVKLPLVIALLLIMGVSTATGAMAKSVHVERIVYGQSGRNQQLICYKISPNHKTSKKLLLNFELHGWEDAYPRDGQVLCDYAKELISYYSSHEAVLKNCTLYVIPSANPDGLRYGYTNNGPGRCQVSLKIDLNRSFDWNFKVRTNSRNKTLGKPQSAPEAKALSSLVISLHPDAVVDFHGWESKVIGNKELANIICKQFRVHYSGNWSRRTSGFFAAWATKYSPRTALVEYPPAAANKKNHAVYCRYTENAVNKIITSYVN